MTGEFMPGFRSLILWLVAAIVVAVIVAGSLIVRRGFSARDEPSWIEKVVARRVRAFAVPASARDAKNPVSLNSEVLEEARAHFADHCAICHANDGDGRTTIGENLYPKAPDMREASTQRLTDGELYYIIQNGIRMTAMPAWGKEGDAHDEHSWKLVHFIRHLNELTPAQLKEMKKMNPKTPDEIEEERQDEAFLRDGPATATSGPAKPGHSHTH